jgi:hypothetical protein
VRETPKKDSWRKLFAGMLKPISTGLGRLCGHGLFAAGRFIEVDQRRIGTTGGTSERDRGSHTLP